MHETNHDISNWKINCLNLNSLYVFSIFRIKRKDINVKLGHKFDHRKILK